MPLRTLDGQSVDAKSLRQQWLLVVVGGGACDEACVQRLYMQRQLRQMLGKERERLDKVWLITDEAPLPALVKEGLGGLEPVVALRAPAAAVAAWLQPDAGRIMFNGEDITRTMLSITIKSIFEDGFFHADPHPGNRLIMGQPAAPVIGMIDLGLVDASWLPKCIPEHAARLQELLDDPDG
jgi:hypothetical protein